MTFGKSQFIHKTNDIAFIDEWSKTYSKIGFILSQICYLWLAEITNEELPDHPLTVDKETFLIFAAYGG